MPKINGVGYSETTLQKQKDFISIFRMLCKIWKGTVKQYWASDRILYYDLNGGYGTSLDCPIIGSPVIAAKVLKESGLLHSGFVCDINEENVLSLQDALLAYSSNFQIIQGDNRTVLVPYLPKNGNNYGLVYIDPNGYPVNEFNFLQNFNRLPGCQKLDILISFSATTVKRTDNAYPHIHNLDKHRQAIGKRFWFIRELMESHHKWSFLLGTNWENFPAPQNYFHKYDSLKGKEILEFFYSSKNKYDETEKNIYQMSMLEGEL